MITLDKKHLALIALAIGIGFCWLKAHDAWRDAEAVKAAQQQVRSQLSTDIGTIQQHSDTVSKQTEQKVQQIQKQAQKPMSSDDIRAMIRGMLPQAQVQEVSSGGLDYIAVEDTPEARAQIQQQKAACDITGVKLSGCTQQLADANAQRDKWQQMANSWQLQSDKFEKAASHGSGFWANVKEWTIRAAVAGLSFEAGRLSKR